MTDTSPPRTLRRLGDLLPYLNNGNFSAHLDELLSKLCAAIEAQPDGAGAGSITITLKVIGVEGKYEIRPTAKSTLPERKPFASNTYWACDGGLALQHPTQNDMFPREIYTNRS